MKQLELSVFLALVAVIFGGHYLFRNTGPLRSHRSTTYVPEANLSDGNSWEAWKETVGNSVSTEAYVKQAPSSMRTVPSKSRTVASSSSSSSSPQLEVNLERMRLNSAPSEGMGAEGNFASSIVLASPSALPSENTALLEPNNNVEGDLIDDPNFLPNLLSLGMFSEGEENRFDGAESLQTQPVSNLSPPSNVERTVVSVPVALQAEVAQLPTTLDKTTASSDPFSPERILWISLLVTSACGGIGLGKYLLPKYQARKQASRHSPPSARHSPPSAQHAIVYRWRWLVHQLLAR